MQKNEKINKITKNKKFYKKRLQYQNNGGIIAMYIMDDWLFILIFRQKTPKKAIKNARKKRVEKVKKP